MKPIARTIESITYTFGHPHHIRFVRTAEKAGLAVAYYHGRFNWAGPAVIVDHLTDAAAVAGRVPCQWETLGMGFIVYPVAYARGEHTALIGTADAVA